MRQFPRLAILIVFTLFYFSVNIFAKDSNGWRPVTPAELKMDKPQVDPEADAEAIFWEVRLDDKKRKKLSYEHYVRVKIFTERGQERFSKFDIPFFKGKKVEDVAARVIKPDGTIIELQPQDIFEREIIKQGKVKIQAKSFAVPGIAPGVIVEYQYRETFKNDSADGERLYFQRDIPIQRVSYYVRPYKGMYLQFFPRNMTLSPVSQADDGFYLATMTDVPAFKEEPRMPPDEETRRWVYLSYSANSALTWSFLARGFSIYFSESIRPDEAVAEKARQLTRDASGKNEQLRKLYEFSQKYIKNTNFENPEGAEYKNKKISDILRNGAGSPRDIDFLFASMAKSLGFSVSLVLSGDRSVNFFDPNRDPVNPSFIHAACVAVLVDNQWKYFNPGTPYLPFGELIWLEEDVYSFHVTESRSFWSKTPLSNYQSSKSLRKGKFRLNEEGVLEGEASIQYTGNLAVDRRRSGIADSDEKRLQEFEEELKEWVGSGEFSGLKIQNFETSDGTLTYSYKVKIPAYASQTGKRLFFQPGIFQYNSKPEFSGEERLHPVYFRFPWSEADEIEIQLPENFEIENFTFPDNVQEKSKLGELRFNLNYDKEKNILTYKRTYYFGGGNNILFPARAYPPLKMLFDLFHKSDSHTLALIRK